MSRRHAENTAVGEDAFLDTTANLVGIIIILVVVIGAKTQFDAEAYGKQLAAADIRPRLESPADHALAVRKSLAEQQHRRQDYEMENRYRKLERDHLLTQVSLVRALVDEKLQATDEQQRQSIAEENELARLKSELDEIQEQMGGVQAAKRPTIVLEHLPTPMAQTVFNREMHVELKAGKVTVIPWDRLIGVLKQQIPLAASRQASRKTLEDTLGPVGGFIMKYRMMAVTGGFELDRFELESVEAGNSESLEAACAPSGRLRLELASRDPAETVVTVWVYPDSFEDFRELKIRLFQEGFLTAARPLPEGVRIGASPRGSRSSAQ